MKFIMTKKSILLAMLCLITACSSTIKLGNTTNKPNENKITPLVSAQWLNDHLNDEHLVLLDTSVLIKMDLTGYKSISGKEKYDKAHIPSARFADLKGNLSALLTKKEFVLPSSQQFQKAMRELGISNTSHVILYSRENESWPTRVWWMLRWGGFNRASILNGGQKAWTDNGFLLTEKELTYQHGNFEFNLQSELVANSHQVKQAISNQNITIIDSLSPAHYQGKIAMYAIKGHITSAINLPSSNLVDESGYFLSSDELELMLDEQTNKQMITYCGGGVAASSVAFNLHRAGYKNVAVYMGSLQEWTETPNNPMTTGDNP
jgi:thiosulfate/3-mercaptopyruvate sulfurtransferase